VAAVVLVGRAPGGEPGRRAGAHGAQGMIVYIVKRLLLMVPTLLGALTITFVVMQFVPGGPIEQIMAEARAGQGAEGGAYKAGRDLDKKQLEDLKKMYGFDKPVHVRYLEMLASYARFDLGKSFLQNKQVWDLIKEKLPVSISLGLWTFLVSYLVSVPLGVAKAVREGSRFDTLTTGLVLLGYAIPGFVLGLLLIVLFAGGSFFDWFPLRGLTSDNWDELSWPARIVDYFWHLALPLTCLVIGSFATITMLTKNTFIEEVRKQYVLVARAKGLAQKRVLYKHIFRNAMIPLVTGFPAAFIGAFFAGALLIETLFSLDGLGLLAYESVIRRDYPVVLGSLYLFTLIALVTKLVTDLLYVVVDPRVQFGAAGR
jgi:microcin C transport system permease protein